MEVREAGGNRSGHAPLDDGEVVEARVVEADRPRPDERDEKGEAGERQRVAPRDGSRGPLHVAREEDEADQRGGQSEERAEAREKVQRRTDRPENAEPGEAPERESHVVVLAEPAAEEPRQDE